METLETCLGHITGNCPDCKADEKNKECPNYTPTTMRTFEVTDEYAEKTQSQ